MIELIKQNRDALVEVCRRYGVARLEVFGSAATEAFDPEVSDIDFLVEFLPDQDIGPWLAHYFDFRDALQRLLGRSVDMVMPAAMKNPYFIRQVNRTRQVLYAA
ncbi:MAG: nucleotidyltransferase domain-containing protein [Phycisphaerae bacterium]|nr:nucleotidyltransferase domain-containing protein [Phycisphaerae bacterium]